MGNSGANAKTVLITGASNDASLAAIQILASQGYSVIGADYRRLPLHARSRYCRSYHLLPNVSFFRFSRALLNLIERTRPDAFLPMDTPSVLAAANHYEHLAELTALNIPAIESVIAACKKDTCMLECQRLGIPAPDVFSLEQAIELLTRNNNSSTLVVKPWIDIGAALGVSYVRNREELERGVYACEQHFGGALIQDFIPGDVLKTVFLLFSRMGELVTAFTTTKVRQWPARGGQAAVSNSTAEQDLIEQVLPFFQERQWRGPAEVDLKLDPRDGQHKLLEINPRFPAYLRFAMHCGLNLPVMATLLSLEEIISPIPFPGYSVGRIYANPGLLFRNILSDLSFRSSFCVPRKAAAYIYASLPTIFGMLRDPVPLIGRTIFDAGYHPNATAPLPRSFSTSPGRDITKEYKL